MAAYPWLAHLTISNPEILRPFADFGIILLLFSVGLELSFKRLWAMRRQVFGLGAQQRGKGQAAARRCAQQADVARCMGFEQFAVGRQRVVQPLQILQREFLCRFQEQKAKCFMCGLMPQLAIFQ